MELSGLQGGQEYRDLDTGRGATQRRYILRRDRRWQTAGQRPRQEARSVAPVYELDPAHRDPSVLGSEVPSSPAERRFQSDELGARKIPGPLKVVIHVVNCDWVRK